MATDQPSGKPGRRPKALATTGQVPAVQELAQELWKLLKDSELTLRQLERSPDMPYSRDTISRRLEGKKCPEDEFIEALLRHCARGDQRQYAALLDRLRPLVQRARREERLGIALSERETRIVLATGQDNRATLRHRAAQAQQLALELSERAAGYQRMCWWLLTWNRGLEQALHQARLERAELQNGPRLDQESLLRLADVRAAILRQDADQTLVRAVLAEAEALRDEALSLAEDAADGYRYLLELLDQAPPPHHDDTAETGQQEPVPSVPTAGTAVLTELRLSIAEHRQELGRLSDAVHALVGPPSPTDPVPQPSVAALAGTTREYAGRSATAVAGAGRAVKVASLVCTVVITIAVWAARPFDSAPNSGAPLADRASSSPSDLFQNALGRILEAEISVAGSGETALAAADQISTLYSQPPPQPPNDVHMIAGPGCGFAASHGETGGGTYALTASDDAFWKAGNHGCGVGYLRADTAYDLGHLSAATAAPNRGEPHWFVWAITTSHTEAQRCQLSVSIPMETQTSDDTGERGGPWATAADYTIAVPTEPTQHKVINQHGNAGKQVILATGIPLISDQTLTVSLSANRAHSDTNQSPDFLVASDLTLDCDKG